MEQPDYRKCCQEWSQNFNEEVIEILLHQVWVYSWRREILRKEAQENETQGRHPMMVQHVLDNSVSDRIQIVSIFNGSKTICV